MTDIYVSEHLPFGLTQTWSLATEVAFYVALPLVMASRSAAAGWPAPVGAVLAVLSS